MKPGRPESHVFSHGQVSRQSSFSSLSKIVFFVGWISHWCSFFPRSWNDGICFLSLKLTLEDRSFGMLCLFLSVSKLAVLTLLIGKTLILGSTERCGERCAQSLAVAEQMHCFCLENLSGKVKQPTEEEGRKASLFCSFYALRLRAARPTNVTKVSLWQGSPSRSWVSWGMVPCLPQKIPFFSSALPVREKLRLSLRSVRSPVTYFPYWKITISPAPCSLQLLFNKLSV